MSDRTLSPLCGVKGVLYVSKGQRWCAVCVATVEPETWPNWIKIPGRRWREEWGPMNNELVGIIVQGRTSQRMTKRQKDLLHWSIHQWFSDQACTATGQVLILGRQNYTITITRLFSRLRNTPPTTKTQEFLDGAGDHSSYGHGPRVQKKPPTSPKVL